MSETKPKKAFTRTHWIILILVLAALFLLSRLTDGGGEGGTFLEGRQTQPDSEEALADAQRERLAAEQAATLKANLAGARSEINLRLATYERAVQEAEDAFLKSLPLETGEEAIRRAYDGVAFLASRDGLCGFGVCVSLAHKMGYDKIKGTSRTEEAIRPVLQEHLVTPLSEAIATYATALERYQETLIRERGALHRDLMAACKELEALTQGLDALSPEALSRAEAAIGDMEGQFREIAEETALMSVAVPAEVLLIKTTAQAFTQLFVGFLRPLFAKAIARLGTSAVAAGTSSLVDGPLPFGEIVGAAIFVGGSAWTGWDIYRITKAMPKTIRNNMHATIDNVRDDLITTAQKRARELAEACRTDARDLNARLGALIEKEVESL